MSLNSILAELFGGKSCEVAILGSEGQKDLDLFVLYRSVDPRDGWRTTLSFLNDIRHLREHTGLEVIVRHEHRTLVPDGSRVLHLLFYPSLEHLRTWEPPSFLAYVHDRGRFLFGDSTSLHEPFREYRRRELEVRIDLREYHLMRYAEIIVGTLIYLTVGSEIFSRSVMCENLLYSLRFTLTELLVGDRDPSAPIDFWDWPELISYLKERFPHQLNLIHLLENRKDVPTRLSTSDLLQVGVETLKLSALGLDGIPEMAIPKLQSERAG